jgi:hypothetical protein
MNEAKQPAYRVNLKLDPELDADLIAWLESLPRGGRSEAIRGGLRLAIGVTPTGGTAVDLEAIRRVVAEELAKVTIRGQATPVPDEPLETPEELEARYGSKLDRLLGGVSQGGNSNADAG